MGQTLTRLLIHGVFSTKHREPLIDERWRKDLHSVMGGILRNRRCDLIAAGGIEDHMHLLVRIPAALAVADMIRDVKAHSSAWRHENGDARFAWQSGYGAFSVSPTLVDTVVEYISNQREHHRIVTFQEEFLKFLKAYEMEYDEGFLWD